MENDELSRVSAQYHRYRAVYAFQKAGNQFYVSTFIEDLKTHKQLHKLQEYRDCQGLSRIAYEIQLRSEMAALIKSLGEADLAEI